MVAISKHATTFHKCDTICLAPNILRIALTFIIYSFPLYRLVEDARSRLKHIFKIADKDLDTTLNVGELVPILLDLAKYEDEDLVQGSIQLLNKLYSSELSLFRRAVQAQLLIEEKSRNLHEYINESQYSLRLYLNPKVVQHSQPSSKGLMPHQSTLNPEVEVGMELPISPLKELTDKCWLPGEAEGFEPHQQNQNIIYNFGELTLIKLIMYLQNKKSCRAQIFNINFTDLFLLV